MTNEPYRQVVHRRLKESYGPTYLTILSMIQSVSLGDLSFVVASHHQNFTLVQWILTLNAFFVLIIIWNVFSVQSVLWGWIPDVRDGVVPFVVGALELFLNYAIAATLSTWLIALALIGIAGAAGTWHIRWRSSHEPENLELLSRLDGHINVYAGYLIGGSCFLLVLAWTSSTTDLDIAAGRPGVRGMLALGIALLTTALLAGSLAIFHVLWRQAIAYARTDDEATSAPTTARDRVKARRLPRLHVPAHRSSDAQAAHERGGMHAMHKARRLRWALLALGVLSLMAAAGLSLQIPPFTAIWPLGNTAAVDLYLCAYTAAIGVSLMWIGVSGEVRAAVAGAISLVVTNAALAISLFVLSRSAKDPRLPAAALLCIGAAILSAGAARWFRRFPSSDVRPLPQAVRLSFAGFVLLLGFVSGGLLLRMPNVFPFPLGPTSAALIGCSFLGSAVYFLYSLTFPIWSNAYAQLWGFLAYDLVLIVPFVLRLGGSDGAHRPALLVNIGVLVYSGALAVFYLLIAKATRVLGPHTLLVPGQDIGQPSAPQHPQIDRPHAVSAERYGGLGDRRLRRIVD